MRYLLPIMLLILISIPSLADDTPEIVEVARFGRGTAYTLAWRPDGEVLAVGSSTGVWFFDEHFNELGRLAEDITVDNLEWSPDGKQLITYNSFFYSLGCDIIIWNVSLDLQQISQEKVFDYCAESIDWSPMGNLIAIGIEDEVTQKSNMMLIAASTLEVIDEYPFLGMYVAFSPDGQHIAINGSGDSGKLTIVPIDVRQDVKTITDNSPMYEPQWSPDGSMISSGCEDEEWEFFGSCVWNIDSGERVFKEWSQTLKWHPNDDSFVVRGQSFYAGFSPLIHYYDNIQQSGIELPSFEFILSLAWHPSGEYFSILNKNIGIDGLISNINIAQTSVTYEQKLFLGNVKSIKWNPENLLLLSTTDSANYVWRWDSVTDILETPSVQITENVGTITQTDTEIRWINPDEFIAITLMTDYGINFAYDNRIYDASSGEVNDTPLYYYGYFDYLTDEGGLPITGWSNKLEQVAYTSFEDRETIIVADKLFTEDETLRFEIQADRLRQIEWSTDDTMIVTAGELGDESVYNFLIEVWNAETGESLSSFLIEWLMHYDHFIWNPDSQSIAVTSHRATGGPGSISAAVYKIKTGEFYKIAPTMATYSWGKYCDDHLFNCYEPQATWSPDGRFLAVSYDDAVRILDPFDSESVITIIDIRGIGMLDWHENGQYLAGVANDGTIYVWDVSTVMAQ